MLQKLVLDQFKSFGERTEVELAKITLLYGQNSAGKSSVIQSLLLMKQTLEAQSFRADSDDEVLVVRGPLTDLASFQALVHRHATAKSVRLGVTLGDPAAPNTFEFEYGLSQPHGDPAAKHAPAIRLLGLKHSDRDSFLNFQRTIGEDALFALDAPSSVMFAERLAGELAGDALPGGSDLLALVAQGSAFPLFEIRGPFPSDIVGLVGRNGFGYTTNELEGAFFLGAIDPEAELDPAMIAVRDGLAHGGDRSVAAWAPKAAALRDTYTEAFNALSYLGPMREPPQRLAILSATPRSHLGLRGENAIQVLAGRSDLITKVNQSLRTLDLDYALDVVEYRDTTTSRKEPGRASLVDVVGRVAGIQLTDRRTGVVVTPSDVGFGISQLLPIVIQVHMARQQVLCIEQPEIHLHPKLQAQLGDVLIESASAGSENQFIIETHSEALMLRLQRRIREGRLQPEDVRVLYVGHDPDRGGYIHPPLKLDSDGDFVDEWPQGFFEERFDEML